MRSIPVPHFALLALAVSVACGEDAHEGRSSEPLLQTPAASDTTVADARTVGGVMARRMETDGLVADLLTAKRRPESLQVTIRFRNVAGGTRELDVDIDDGMYDDWHLTAGGEEIPLRVDEYAPGDLEASLRPGETLLWRGEYVPPPEDVESFDLEFPGLVLPFEDVPIDDAEDTQESLFPID